MKFLRQTLAIAAKDLRSEIRGKEAVNASVSFALVILLLFSFAFDLEPEQIRDIAGGLLWLVFAFAGTLILNRSFARELVNDCLDALLASPVSGAQLFFGKCLANYVLIVIVECISLPVFVIFYNVRLPQRLALLFLVMLLGTWGITVIGTMFSAMTVNLRLRELMLPTLIYPMLIPALVGAIELSRVLINRRSAGRKPDLVSYSGGVQRHLHHFVSGFGRNRSSGVNSMRLKIILTLTAIAGLILAWNLHRIFLQVPDEANQGAIFRIIYFHVPAAITSFTGFYLAMFSAIGYLITQRSAAGLHRCLHQRSLPRLRHYHALHRQHLGPHHLGHLVDLGPAPHVVLCLLADLRRLLSCCAAPSTIPRRAPGFRRCCRSLRASILCWSGNRLNGFARSTPARFWKSAVAAAWPLGWKRPCGGIFWLC